MLSGPGRRSDGNRGGDDTAGADAPAGGTQQPLGGTPDEGTGGWAARQRVSEPASTPPCQPSACSLLLADSSSRTGCLCVHCDPCPGAGAQAATRAREDAEMTLLQTALPPEAVSDMSLEDLQVTARAFLRVHRCTSTSPICLPDSHSFFVCAVDFLCVAFARFLARE